MDLGLKDKVALVTGGSKGIGEAIVRGLIGEGAHVANVNRSTAEGQAMEKAYAAEGKQCPFIQADLSDPEASRRCVETVLDRFGRLDVLVNNAGVNDGVGLDAGPDAFVASLMRNLVHYYAMVHHALPALRASRGVVINVSSKVATTGQGGTSGYAAAKGAINGLTREWAVDLAPDGIRVNTVVPAETWTPLYAGYLESTEDPAAVKRSIEAMIPLGHRFTTAQEIADTVIFVASDRSSHTTGQILYVDGGYTHFDRKVTSAATGVRLSGT